MPAEEGPASLLNLNIFLFSKGSSHGVPGVKFNRDSQLGSADHVSVEELMAMVIGTEVSNLNGKLSSSEEGVVVGG
jgi:hypothetical protein